MTRETPGTQRQREGVTGTRRPGAGVSWEGGLWTGGESRENVAGAQGNRGPHSQPGATGPPGASSRPQGLLHLPPQRGLNSLLALKRARSPQTTGKPGRSGTLSGALLLEGNTLGVGGPRAGRGQWSWARVASALQSRSERVQACAGVCRRALRAPSFPSLPPLRRVPGGPRPPSPRGMLL